LQLQMGIMFCSMVMKLTKEELATCGKESSANSGNLRAGTVKHQ